MDAVALVAAAMFTVIKDRNICGCNFNFCKEEILQPFQYCG